MEKDYELYLSGFIEGKFSFIEEMQRLYKEGLDLKEENNWSTRGYNDAIMYYNDACVKKGMPILEAINSDAKAIAMLSYMKRLEESEDYDLTGPTISL